MIFAVERSLRQLLVSLQFGELLNSDGSIRVKRGDSTALSFPVGDRFGVPATLGAPTVMKFGAKVVGQDDGSYVVSNYNSGTGLFDFSLDAGTKVYTLSPSWDTAKLNNLLGYDPEGFAETTEIRCEADVAGSLDGKYFVLRDKAGTVGVWIAIDNGGTGAPAGASGCTRAIKVTTLNTGDTASAIATKLAAKLALDAQFAGTTADSGDLVTVVDTFIGPRTAAADGTTGFGISRWIAGSLPNTMANVASVTLDGEIRWSENGVVSSTVTFPVVVSFDVNNGGGFPRRATPVYPAPGLLLTTSAAGAGFTDGAQNGRSAITNGAGTVAVVFANAFSVAPQLAGTPCVEKAADGDDDVFCTGVSSLGTAGFTAHLSAPVGNGNYKLHWYAFKASA